MAQVRGCPSDSAPSRLRSAVGTPYSLPSISPDRKRSKHTARTSKPPQGQSRASRASSDL
eukprot:6019575-Pyramimonas_sp.AAC.1